MPTDAIAIRPPKTHDEFRQCENLQKAVWGTVAASSELLFVTQKNGGMVLGAFANQQVVGFIYAFLGRRHGRLIHWSHMMAVEPAYRDRRLGFKMKLVHRELALAQHISCIAWTYDPLQSRNAFLNLARLGAEVNEYLPDCYGQFPSAIEKGLPSDRFVAVWQIANRRVEKKITGNAPKPSPANLTRVNETRSGARGLIENARLHLNLDHPRILVEVPANTDRMRELDMELALRWRLEARRIFQHYFAAGYRAVDFVAPAVGVDAGAFYVLARRRTK